MSKNNSVYLRFVLPHKNDMSGVAQGPFELAYKIRRENRLAPHEHDWLDSNLKWFGANLMIPDRFNRCTSKGYWRKDTKGICWFKASAHECIKRMREVGLVLAQHGHIVSEIKTKRPGFIVFEDEYQVVAEPFSETPTTWK